MNQTIMKKLVISSIALTLVLNGSSLFALEASAQAQAGLAKIQNGMNDGSKLGEQKNGRHGQKWPIVEESAALLGIDKEALVKSLKGGKSIVEVAAEKGVSEQDLTAKLQQLRTGKIESAVKDGKLTADQGEHMKQRLDEHLKFILNEKNLFKKRDGAGKWHKIGLRPDSEKLAKTLGMSEDELRAQLKAGKSLTEIAKSKGISKDKLVASIKDQLTPSIEKMVDRKKSAE
ncbi:hypothetical protein [Paenibacillus sp. SI8]|uniref:hypothetical protein n=1 Tax=unclassified Paenibacillus TaxID=185978 RepID=UPI0034661B3B